MALYKDEGIVIRERPLGEADKLLTILTRNKEKFQLQPGGAELAIAFWDNSIVLSLAFLVLTGRGLATVGQAEGHRVVCWA